MEMDAADIHSRSDQALDPWWQENEGKTWRRDEGSRVELGPGDKADNGQATLAFFGVGLMCDPHEEN